MATTKVKSNEVQIAALAARKKAKIAYDPKKHVEVENLGFIAKSGVYKIKIVSVFEDFTAAGAVRLNVVFTTADSMRGEANTWTVNKEGKDIQRGQSKFESLLGVTGKSKVTPTEGVKEVYGKDVAVLEYKAFEGVECQICVQAEYSTYTDSKDSSITKVGRNFAIQRFFNKAGFVSTEIRKKAEEPKAIILEAKTKDKFEQGSGLTAEIVDNYYKDGVLRLDGKSGETSDEDLDDIYDEASEDIKETAAEEPAKKAKPKAKAKAKAKVEEVVDDEEEEVVDDEDWSEADNDDAADTAEDADADSDDDDDWDE